MHTVKQKYLVSLSDEVNQQTNTRAHKKYKNKTKHVQSLIRKRTTFISLSNKSFARWWNPFVKSVLIQNKQHFHQRNDEKFHFPIMSPWSIYYRFSVMAFAYRQIWQVTVNHNMGKPKLIQWMLAKETVRNPSRIVLARNRKSSWTRVWD